MYKDYQNKYMHVTKNQNCPSSGLPRTGTSHFSSDEVFCAQVIQRGTFARDQKFNRCISRKIQSWGKIYTQPTVVLNSSYSLILFRQPVIAKYKKIS